MQNPYLPSTCLISYKSSTLSSLKCAMMLLLAVFLLLLQSHNVEYSIVLDVISAMFNLKKRENGFVLYYNVNYLRSNNLFRPFYVYICLLFTSQSSHGHNISVIFESSRKGNIQRSSPASHCYRTSRSYPFVSCSIFHILAHFCHSVIFSMISL